MAKKPQDIDPFVEMADCVATEDVTAEKEITGNDIWIAMRRKSIIDIHGQLVAFEPFPNQRKLLEMFCDAWDAMQLLRYIILKSRRMGCTAAIACFIFSLCQLIRNQSAMIIAHEIEAARVIFSMYQLYESESPDEDRKDLRYCNYRWMEWTKPHYSRLRVATASRKELGRSSGNRYLHNSEVAFWDNARAALAVSQTVPKDPRTLVAWESTANGMGAFKEQWDQANDPKALSDYIPVFMKWTDFKQYWTAPIKGEIIKPTPQEAEYITQHSLNAGQAKWFMTTLHDQCANNIDFWNQEYPATPRLAFISAGSPFFNQEILARWGARIATEEPVIRGNIELEYAA